MEIPARQCNPIDMQMRKDIKIPNQENTGIKNQYNESKVFQYKQDGGILNFQFVSNKRVKCPTCRIEFKNILRHIQQSDCRISNRVDFSERFKQFTKVHLEKQMKDDHRKRQEKSVAKQREDDDQQVKNNQNKRRAKSVARQK